ncbi:MAG: HupE/UreJ family protein [Gemmatimonadota bacterium]
MSRNAVPVRRTAALVVALVLLLPSWPEAHEIPADVTIQAFVKPDGDRLRLLLRVPLQSMRDYDFPLRGPGYLELTAAGALARDAARQWIGDYVEFRENGVPLEGLELEALRISAPGDRAFGDYETALEHVRSAPLPAGTELYWQQAALDVLFEVPIASDRSEFDIDPRFAHLGLRTVTVLRFLPDAETERVFQYTGNPGLVRLDPRWHQAALRFVVLGFEHILDGIDHLLFLLCLVIPFRSVRALVPVVTAFTVAHSITLIASALGLAPDGLWFPPLIETLIAASIVFMAFENILGAKLHRRWMIAFGFGLVHGFGFSFVLSESLQFAGGHLITSLLSFNVGVELGQILVLLIAAPLLELAFRKGIPETAGVIVLSAVLAHTGWHWMTERGADFLQYEITAPALDLGFAATLLRWLALALVVAGAAWMLRGAFAWLSTRFPGATAPASPSPAPSGTPHSR